MSIFRRRISIEEMFERLRLASSECSGLGLEEMEESQMEQASAVTTKEYCCYRRCNLAFGLAEKRVATGPGQVMHEDCYVKHLRDEHNRAQRIHTNLRVH